MCRAATPFWLWIERLAAHGAISGYTCGGPGEPCVPPGNRPYFRWGANATRGQIAKIDAIAAGYRRPDPDDAADVRGCAGQQPVLAVDRAVGRARHHQRLHLRRAGRALRAAGQPALLPLGRQRHPRPDGQDRRPDLLPRLPDAGEAMSNGTMDDGRWTMDDDCVLRIACCVMRVLIPDA